VRKREQKCLPVSDHTEKSKSSNCVVENILQYHKIMTFDIENDFEDEYWENKLNSNTLWYNLHCCSSIAFKFDLKIIISVKIMKMLLIMLLIMMKMMKMMKTTKNHYHHT